MSRFYKNKKPRLTSKRNSARFIYHPCLRRIGPTMSRPLEQISSYFKLSSDVRSHTPLSDRIKLRRLELSNSYLPNIDEKQASTSCNRDLRMSETIMLPLENSAELKPKLSLGWISTICPLSGKIMKFPVRGQRCRHFYCFDRESFRIVWINNNRCPTPCPICGTSLNFTDLTPNEYLANAISIASPGCIFVRFNNNIVEQLKYENITSLFRDIYSMELDNKNDKPSRIESDLSIALALCDEISERAWVAERQADDALKKYQIAEAEMKQFRFLSSPSDFVIMELRRKQDRIDFLECQLSKEEIQCAKLSDQLLICTMNFENLKMDLDMTHREYVSVEDKFLCGRFAFCGTPPTAIDIPVRCLPAVSDPCDQNKTGRLRELILQRASQKGLFNE